nr:LOW QUALITY PROTEIN: putative late blight resistance protein homolog R1A-3 [Solanum lycopersicum]
MERGKENEGQTKGEDNKSLVSSAVLCKDIADLQDFVERLKNEQDQVEELKFLLACLQLCYYISDAEMSCISYEVHDLVQSLLHQSSGDDMMVKLTDHVVPRLLEDITSFKISDHHHSASMNEDQLDELLDVLLVNLYNLPKVRVELISPSMTQYELLRNVFGNLRDFHALKVNGCVEYETIEYVLPQFQLTAERVGHFCFVLLSYHLDKTDEVNSMLVHLLLKIIPVSLDVMHICCTNLKGSNSEEVGFFIKQLLEASPDILRESLIHLQEHMLINAVTPSASTYNIHVMIEFLLIILTDGLKAVIRHDKLFVLLAHVIQLTKEVFVFFRNLEENMNEESGSNLNLLENIELLKVDLKNDFLKARADLSPLPFPMSDGPLFMNLLLTDLKDLAYSNAYSVSLINEEIKQVKQDLEIIRSLFGYAEQELIKDLWTRVLDLAHEAQHAINSILARDQGLLQLIFILPDTIEKIKLVKKEVQEKLPKSSSIIVANAPKNPVERNSSSTVGKIIVGYEEETEWIIRKLTSGPAELDVISIVGMPGLGKTTLAYRVYNHKSIVDHYDVCAWCTVDQERNEKKLLQKIFNQVKGLEERSSEDHDIDDDVADKLRKRLCGQRYLIVLDDMWDTATLDELMRPFPEFHKGSRVILTSRKKEIALHGKCHSDPLYLRLLRSEESWELLEKRVFGEEGCPDELKDVGKKIARRCGGLPLLVDLIGGVISRKEKKEALWAEVLNDLSSSIFKDEEEVVKVIQLSYDHLSDHVKPCFVYLASFPKDEDISMSELKDLWISQGLEMKSAEEVVDELISSSLVIPFDDSIFKIHDLVHDFCDIKCRKEKLLHFIRGSKAPSSSDLMTRGIIVHYNHYVYPSDEYFTMFDPEQKIPSVKHLLSLKGFSMTSFCLSYKSHLKHFRLLKSLDLCGVTLPESLLNEIGMLVHLKYLKIWMKAKVLPPSFSNLCNLETLMVNADLSCMRLSPWFWSLAKLRVVEMTWGAVFDPVITVLDEDLRLENLTTLHKFYLLGLEDTEDIFKRFPNLKNLQVRFREQIPENICFPRFDFLNKLEQLHLFVFPQNSFPEYTRGFPLSLKILKLKGFAVTSDTLSRLPNLEELSLEDATIEEGKEWNMEDHVAFQNLKSLTLSRLIFSKWNMEDHVIFQDLKYLELEALNFSEWKVDAEKSFPVLKKLFIDSCDKLMEIPDSFGDIASLKCINVQYSSQLKESMFKIKEYVEEMTGEDKLHVEFYNWGS